MASIVLQPRGRRLIQFQDGLGRRRTIRLGKLSQRTAEGIKLRVEQLVTTSLTGFAPDDEAARWVASLDGPMRDRLAAVGLVPARESATLAAFLDAYISSRTDVKGATMLVYGHTRRCLVEHFGADRHLRTIT